MKDTIKPGAVAWTGDNPFIYLKTSPAQDWSALALYFRIALSPYGSGQAMLLVRPSATVAQAAETPLCLTDNAAMARYLIENFVSKFALFRPHAEVLAQTDFVSDAQFTQDLSKSNAHQQTAHHVARALSLRMTWSDLQQPFMVDVPAAKTQTGRHEMFTAFQPASAASIELCGVRLAGQTVERDFFDRRAQSAALAFSETWVESEVS